MSGTLFVVSTPIGNLEDVTLRAVRVLREVELIAAEDTRRSAQLLARHGISTPTLSFHQHNVRRRLPQLLLRLRAGAQVALVTDAGTPGISDPGVELVQACVDAGISIDPVPGVSAPLTAAIASGFPLNPLTIYGFPPSRSKDRKRWLADVSKVSNTLTFFETPHRIKSTMLEAAPVFVNRPIMLGRELTKVHQQFMRGIALELVDQLDRVKGEFTVVVGPIPIVAESDSTAPESVIASDFWDTTEIEGLSRRAAITAVAKKYRIPAKRVYSIVEKSKTSVK